VGFYSAFLVASKATRTYLSRARVRDRDRVRVRVRLL